jgi:hypothetical protein
VATGRWFNLYDSRSREKMIDADLGLGMSKEKAARLLESRLLGQALR